MSKIIIGGLAHVDAGKTTLSEALLYKCGATLNMGRVDKGNSFLDYDVQERERGITIYNKEARFKYKDKEYIYVDTPGHNEFSSEACRAYKILDLALLIISGSERIYNDDILKFNSLRELNVPIVIFVNKEDNLYASKEEIVKNIQKHFSSECVYIDDIEEHVALESEELLEMLLNDGSIDDSHVKRSIMLGNTVPVLFGSALKDSGIDELLEFLYRYIDYPKYEDSFRAYLYAVSNDNGLKLSHLKILGGTLENKTAFGNEKINEIRLYSGQNFIPAQSVMAGELCAVSGLNLSIGTYLPSLINESKDESKALTYEVRSDLDNNELYRRIEVLNFELPELNIQLEENHLYIDLKGELHKQIVFNLLKERFKVEVSFSDPVIRYKESIRESSIGVGHFEPLRHYAELIVEIKPSESLCFRSLVNNSYTGSLINYLNTHKLRGILTNSELCRMEITIIDFRTHLKHTEGGDLIQALRRAIRHALTRNKCYMLEPYYLINIDGGDNLNTLINILNTERFTYTVNEDSLTCKIPLKQFNRFILYLRNRLKDELSYNVIEEVYDEALNEEEIIKNRGYDYTNDFYNPAGSVFTYHGAGHYVNEEEVIDKMHLDLSDYFKDESQSVKHINSSISENELNRVWNSLYKPKERTIYKPRTVAEEVERIEIKYKPIIYLIDGYNLMYFLDELKDTVSSNFLMAREKVIDLVCDFKGYVNADVVLVFDAYRQEYSKPQISDNDLITVVYTRSLQTADTYIENAARDLSDKYKVITVTNDHLEQLRVFSNDSFRLSCGEFMKRYENMKKACVQKELPKNKPLSDLRKLLENE